MIDLPNLKGKELFAWLIANKSVLIAQKKFEVKRSDAVSHTGIIENDKGRTVKANGADLSAKTELAVTSIINTTNWYDSHGDVHIDGLWKKSLQETKQLYLLQEHELKFDHIISDEVRAYTKRMAWRTLGYDIDGYTEALVFESNVKQKRNPYMFDQYRDGNVKQHSVGMRYRDIEIAINDDDYPTYKQVWDNYYDKIANKADVDEAGYFWAVTQAQVIEGSAVPIGSNVMTPTTSVKNIEPVTSTHSSAAKSAQRLTALNKLLKQTQL